MGAAIKLQPRSSHDPPSFGATLIDGRFDIPKESEQVAWLLEPGVCYQVVFCATDSSGNASCSAVQPFVREVQSCWANDSVASDATHIDQDARNLWCAPPAIAPPTSPVIASASHRSAHRDALLLAAGIGLFGLLLRLRRTRRAMEQLGRR